MKGYGWNRIYNLRELKREARILNNIKHNNKKTRTYEYCIKYEEDSMKQIEAPYKLWEQHSATDKEIAACEGDYIGCEICYWRKRCAMLLSKKIDEVQQH